jgi:hypothetical protein
MAIPVKKAKALRRCLPARNATARRSSSTRLAVPCCTANWASNPEPQTEALYRDLLQQRRAATPAPSPLAGEVYGPDT